jgi:predicted ATP-grasp superfamily ATP-dependent carboligase
MNLFYTGLGIARSLGEHGVPVIGLTAHRRSYGNLTRFADIRHCPDSRENPEALLPFLLRLGETLPGRAVIFPTRDDDLIFLDRYRDQLAPYFIPVVPESAALQASLDKWETFHRARAADVPVPGCWIVDGREDAARVAAEVSFPAVLKPVSAHQWRKTGNWRIVGERKAVPVASPAEFLSEYEVIARAESRVLVQEMVPGGDALLRVAACYMDSRSNLVAAFTARKVLQVPAGFGTGCIVETADCPQVLELASKLLRSIGFSGIAEVEFKWDEASRQYKLIEINPRPWDQHRLGAAAGVDLIRAAYHDLTGAAPLPASAPRPGQ